MPRPWGVKGAGKDEGIFYFTDMYRLTEATGFLGHYMAAFGSLDDVPGGGEVLDVEMGKG